MMYVIVMTQEWYGPRITKKVLSDRYNTKDEAKKAKYDIEGERFLWLEHNEYARRYDVVRVDRLPKYLKEQL